MADNGEGMMMGDLSCAQVRDWLPLLVGDGEEIAGDEGDLGVEDRRRTEGHLIRCASCRRHRVALEEALSVLGAVAAEPPVGPGDGSLWLALEGRVRGRQGRDRVAWASALLAACPRAIRVAADRLGRGWEEARGQLPFRMAWTKDSARDFLEARLRLVGSVPRLCRVPAFGGAVPGLAMALGLALLVGLAVVPMAYRRQARAEAQIAANASPLPAVEVAPREPLGPSEMAELDTEIEVRTGDAVAQADPPPAAKVQAAGRSQGAASRSAAAAPSPRYDLEYGIPMPPDSRVGKPAY
jgi:hypothetical protein